jgi:hypothetical protein
VVQSDPVTAANNVQAQLQYLTACCRGLQSPNDDYQSLVARNAAYDMFASGSINVLYESVPGAAELSRTINDTITQIVYLYSKDQETTQVSVQGVFTVHSMETLGSEPSLGAMSIFRCWFALDESSSLLATVHPAIHYTAQL